MGGNSCSTLPYLCTFRLNFEWLNMSRFTMEVTCPHTGANLKWLWMVESDRWGSPHLSKPSTYSKAVKNWQCPENCWKWKDRPKYTNPPHWQFFHLIPYSAITWPHPRVAPGDFPCYHPVSAPRIILLVMHAPARLDDNFGPNTWEGWGKGH